MSAKNKFASKSRREMRQAKRQRQQLLWRAILGLAGAAALAGIGYVTWDALRPKPGQSIPPQARTHIQVGDPHEPYNSDPPTSGPHASAVQEGFYTDVIPDENLVHNLEHGYVILWYNCSALDEAQCGSLKAQIGGVIDRAESVVIGGDKKKLIAAPRPTMEAQIALTSWGRLLELNRFDEAQISAFIKEFRNKAPEPNAP